MCALVLAITATSSIVAAKPAPRPADAPATPPPSAIATALADEATGLPPQPTIAPSVAARIPDAGYWFATHTRHGSKDLGPDVFFIYRLRRTGLEVVHRATASLDDFKWLDARTLLTLRTTRDQVVVQRYVDGVAQPANTIEDQAWNVPERLRAAQRTDVRSPDDRLLITRRGQAWARRCVAAQRNRDRCDAWRYLRVDTTPTVTTRAPRDLVTPQAPPRAKRPAGVQVQLATVAAPTNTDRGEVTRPTKGFRCTAGGTTTRWPADDPGFDPWFPLAVDTIKWRSASPPIFEVLGASSDPSGARFRGSRLFRACERSPIDAVTWLRDGLHAEFTAIVVGTSYVHARIAIAHRGVPVAVLLGAEGTVELAPPP